MTKMTASNAREHFADTINRVAYRGERIVLYRRGKSLVAVVPITDLAALEQLEDRLDLEAAKRALAESSERIPYEQVRQQLGLKRKKQ